jgi:UDP-glucose 4-epimerase
MVEHILADYNRSQEIEYIALRYFNAAGADPEGDLGECHDPETHLIPRLLMAAQTIQPVFVYGTDYPTPDGTCIRDFIHVDDLARAHVLALKKILGGADTPDRTAACKPACADIYNLSTGLGHSVHEVIKTVEEVTGKRLDVRISDRRPGDPPVLVGNPAKVRLELGWDARCALRDMIATAWKWYLSDGY